MQIKVYRDNKSVTVYSDVYKIEDYRAAVKIYYYTNIETLDRSTAILSKANMEKFEVYFNDNCTGA